MYLRLSELQSKKIINIVSGSSVGNIIDLEVSNDGKIESLLIDQGKSIFSLNKDGNLRIQWSDIVKIGEDVILIKKE